MNSATLPRTGAWTPSRDEAIRSALKAMRRGGVDIDRAPKQALELAIEATVTVEDHPALRERGKKEVGRRTPTAGGSRFANPSYAVASIS
jgi:hypothetical protein